MDGMFISNPAATRQGFVFGKQVALVKMIRYP